MAEKVLLTEKGKQELEQRLEYLKTVKRAEIKEAAVATIIQSSKIFHRSKTIAG